MAAVANFRLRGVESGTTAPTILDDEITLKSARRIRPGSARAGGEAGANLPADAVVRLELENGFVLWTRADDLVRERGRKLIGRDGSESWEISMLPQPGSRARGTSRGWLGLGIKVLEFFGIDIRKKAVGKLAGKLEEKQLRGNAPGLHRCSLAAGDGPRLQRLGDDDVIATDQGPLLIFLHGTGSSTRGSFGKLWAADNKAGATALERLRERYGERAFALEHRSLTESPLANAQAILRHLAKGAEVHLVSHSRGGLVGELLCLGMRERSPDALDDAYLGELFAADRTVAEQLGLTPLDGDARKARDQAYAEDRKRLAALRDELDAKQIRVRRFVRVACPARGTTLASGRLDRWLSVLDFLAGATLFGEAVDFVMAVVKERTDPRTLPGLEAMMPGSALTRLLQHPDLMVSADLSVIAGDIEGDSLWSQIKLLAADWFYGSEHDLVVNTGSMSGGLRRTAGCARLLRDQGPEVNHFRYFENERSVKWLLAGLTRGEDSDGGFRPIAEASHEPPRWREALRRSRSASTPRPLAVVLPGTMGSVLQATGETVWLHYWRLARGGLKRLAMGKPDIEPVDLVGDFYGPLVEYLARTHRVEIFPYDWRMSVREAAARLAEALEDLVTDAERDHQPVHLVAHSMGGLVVRAMIADEGRGAAVWQRIIALPKSRFMMLGTPNLGSHEAVRWLTGGNPTELKLALLDLTQSTTGIIDIVSEYPGLLELLPFDPAGKDFSEAALWKSLKAELDAVWKPAPAAALRAARVTWERLRKAPPDPQHMIYVAGCQPATVIDYRTEAGDSLFGFGGRKLLFDGTGRGDGTVSWASGLLPGVPTWYVEDTAHDALCAQKRAFPGYLDLLVSGTTQRLPASPPALSRAGGGALPERFPMPTPPFTDDIPDEATVLRLGFGQGLPDEFSDQTPAAPAIRLSVRHGDLAYARFPVVVGHYEGDSVVSAEAALDQRLDYALTRRLQLGLYPAQLGSHALFFSDQPKARPAGAVVVGLGQIGELSPGLLEGGLRAALLDYALQVAQGCDTERFGSRDKVRSAAVSCLLVGSGAGGIPVRASVEAIVRAAVAANARLADRSLDAMVLIDEIEFVELFEDVAIGCTEALHAVLRDEQLAVRVSWPDRNIQEGEGRRRRVRFDEQPEWWHRLEITQDKKAEALRFVFATDRARAEETLVAGQLDLAETFIRQASASPSANSEVAKTLFEMLLPNRLKQMAPQEAALVLQVDETSARYPWELLEDRWSASGRPPAVAGGLVRQLKTQEFRPEPAHSPQAKAFVVGNPDLEAWADFADLPGARQEAERVASQLRSSGYEVRDSIDESADAILAGLHRDAWRILHLAGHGDHEYPLPRADGSTRPVSGMVIGRNAFLTPGDVEQMRWVPELVFINCCHLGKTESSKERKYGQLAANLAVEFIRMGVKAVVAAGWAVDDAAANAFATTFYRRLLDGTPFGEAVRAAREEVWARFPGVNTWGAYQCYGDHSYRLRGDGSAGLRRTPSPYVAPSELVTALDNLVSQIRMQSRRTDDDPDQLADMRAAIAREQARVPEAMRDEWHDRADVAAALGFAWGETGAYAEGIEWLERAIVSDLGDCPVRAVEQCANFRVRLSGETWQRLREQDGGEEEDRAKLIGEIEKAIAELDLICQRAPTAERYNLLGSACKRLAWLHRDEPRRLEALINMANYYGLAMQVRARAGKGVDPYPAANRAAAQVLAAWHGGEQAPPGLGGECEAMIEAAAERNARDPSFWDTVAEADCSLVKLLAGRASGAAARNAAQAVSERYRAALGRGASPRQRASIIEHLDFLAALAESASPSLRRALASIRSAL